MKPLNLMFATDFEPEDADYYQMIEDDMRAEADYERHDYRDECESDDYSSLVDIRYTSDEQ